MTTGSAERRFDAGQEKELPQSETRETGEESLIPAPQVREYDTAAQTATAGRRRHDAALLGAADICSSAAVVTVFAGAEAALPLLAPLTCGLVTLHARAGLYRPGLAAYALAELPALTTRSVIAWCAAIAVLAVAGIPVPGTAVLLAAVASHALLTCAARAVVHAARRRRARLRPRPALVAGGDDLARTVAAVLTEHPRYGLRPVGFIDPAPGAELAGDASLPVHSAPDDTLRAVRRDAVRDIVFLRTPWEDGRSAALADLLADQGVTGWLIRPGCAEGGHGTHEAGPAHVWGFACRRLPLRCPAPGRRRRLKRLLDVLLVVPALVAAAPLMAACALAVRLSDGPGTLFRQERVGLGGRPFTLLKFRTLRPADSWESATRWSVADDDRMSRVGRVLRRTSLDELPQLWNVLRGDMSLVGPRPERPHFVQQFSQKFPGYADRHRAPVGITGLAQVHGLRGNTSIEERARFDNHYIETWSLWQDIQIMVRTAASFIRLEGR